MPRLSGDSNVLLTDDVIAKEAMRLLKNELVALRLVHRNHEQVFGKVGDTISIKKPARIKSASGRTLVKQPMVDEVTTLSVDNQEHVGLEFNAIERTLSLSEFSSRYLKSGVSQIAHQIDLSILNEAKKAGFFSSGTPGTAIDEDNFIDAAAYMQMVGVPSDGLCSAVLNPLDAASYRKSIKGLRNESMVKEAIERSYLGQLSNMNSFETAQMTTHTVGALGGTPTVNGASQSGKTLVIDGASNSVTGWALTGDVFYIAGVYEVNPRTYLSTGRLQRFVVTEDADSDGSGNVTLSISPGINDGSNTTVDANGATVSLAAYQNVDSEPADNATLTFIGTAGTTYRQSLALHRDAIAFAAVDIHLPESAPIKKRVRDEETGLSLTLTAQYDVNDMSEIYRLDALWGVKSVYPELIHRIFSG